jgi:hypothetical protein
MCISAGKMVVTYDSESHNEGLGGWKYQIVLILNNTL